MLEKIEVAVSTYNRCQILSKWFDGFLPSLDQYGILVSIYDSSENEETRELVDKLNKARETNRKIRYFRVPAETRVDAKVLSSILNAEREYVWPMGDARICDLTNLEEKGDSCFAEDIGFISLGQNYQDDDRKIYDKPENYFRDKFWQSTLLGGLIFRKNIFASLNDQITMDYFLGKYSRNDGFSYLGIFYELIVRNVKTKGILLNFGFANVGPRKKPNWLKRYLEVWCDNLCYVVDCLPQEYAPYKDKALKLTWKEIKGDGWPWLLRARIENGINPDVFKKYSKNHLLERVTERQGRIRLVAYMPIFMAKTLYFLLRVYLKIRRTIAKIRRGGK